MGIVDLIFVIIFGYAIYKGFKNGIVVEICGILGIIISVYIAIKFKSDLAKMFDMDPTLANIISFVIILLLGVIFLHFVAKLITKVIQLTGLGVINSLLGAIASLFKMIIIISLVTSIFLAINSNLGWVSGSHLSKSVILPKLNTVSKRLFSHVDFLKQYYNDIKESIFEDEGDSN